MFSVVFDEMNLKENVPCNTEKDQVSGPDDLVL